MPTISEYPKVGIYHYFERTKLQVILGNYEYILRKFWATFVIFLQILFNLCYTYLFCFHPNFETITQLSIVATQSQLLPLWPRVDRGFQMGLKFHCHGQKQHGGFSNMTDWGGRFRFFRDIQTKNVKGWRLNFHKAYKCYNSLSTTVMVNKFGHQLSDRHKLIWGYF